MAEAKFPWQTGPEAEHQILLVEDSAETRADFIEKLKPMHVHVCRRLREAEVRIPEEDWDVILIDMFLPDGMGIDLLPGINPNTGSIPRDRMPEFIIFSSSDDTELKMRAYAEGAIEFLTKPVDPFLLRARIQGLLRLRSRMRWSPGKMEPDLQVDEIRKIVWIRNEKGERQMVKLTRTEYTLLHSLWLERNTTVSRERLSSKVWHGLALSDRTLDSHICRLRKKIQSPAVHLEPVYGFGYVLQVSSPQTGATSALETKH